MAGGSAETPLGWLLYATMGAPNSRDTPAVCGWEAVVQPGFVVVLLKQQGVAPAVSTITPRRASMVG